MAIGLSYLGQAIKYPLQLTNGTIQLQSGSALVAQSIKTILSTPVGSVFSNREFGSRIKELVFEPNDTLLVNLLTHVIADAVAKWESRVQFITASFSFDYDNGLINCMVVYRLLSSNEINAVLFPYQRNSI